MLKSMSWKEFVDWQHFDELEPFTAIRDDLRFASIVQCLHNLHRNRKEFPDEWPLTDFLLIFGDKEEREKQRTALGRSSKPVKPKQKSWQDLKATGQFLAALYNALEENPEDDEKPKGRRKKRG